MVEGSVLLTQPLSALPHQADLAAHLRPAFKLVPSSPYGSAEAPLPLRLWLRQSLPSSLTTGEGGEETQNTTT